MNTITRGEWQGFLGLGLSRREVEFTLGVTVGMTDKQIAHEYGLAPDTVRKRIANAMYKLGASRRPRLVAEAMRRAIIAPLVVLLGIFCITVSANPDVEQHRAPRVRVARSVKSGREDLLPTPFFV